MAEAEERKPIPAKIRLVSEADKGKLEGAKIRLASEGEVPPGAVKIKLVKEEETK